MAVAVGGIEHTVAIRPCPGEPRPGDAAVVREFGEHALLAAIIDVTGHGWSASHIAARIARYLETCRPADPITLLERLDEMLKGSVGAAVGIAVIDSSSATLSYAGTGNTVIRRVGVDDNRLVSREGVVGVRMRTPKAQELKLHDRDLVLMYTDGISERMPFDNHDGSRHLPTAQIAAALLENYSKGHDDAGCIVLRFRDH